MSEEEPADPEYELCTEAAGYCNDVPIVDDDYKLEEEWRDEL